MKKILILVIICFSLLYLFVNYRKENRKNKCLVTIGTISNVVWGHKNGRYIIHANFSIKKNSYSISCLIPCTTIAFKDLSQKLLGKKVFIVYDSTNSNNSQLLLEEIAFKDYNISMPDSLKWIDSLVTCKK